MKISLTKKSIKDFYLEKKLEEGLEEPSIFHWSAKIFYSQGKKGLQLMHTESQLHLWIFDYKVSDFKNLKETVFDLLYYVFAMQKGFWPLLQKFYEDSGEISYASLHDRFAVARLNRAQLELLDYGSINEYIYDECLDTLELNVLENLEGILAIKTEGKKEYYSPADLFQKQITEYYLQQKNS